jgi:hypothetical protein
MTQVITTDDVTESILRIAEQVFEDWFDFDEPIDWDDDSYGFWTRMEDHDIDLGEQLDTPAMRKIQRHIRKYRKEG